IPCFRPFACLPRKPDARSCRRESWISAVKGMLPECQGTLAKLWNLGSIPRFIGGRCVTVPKANAGFRRSLIGAMLETIPVWERPMILHLAVGLLSSHIVLAAEQIPQFNIEPGC